jgi:hypothetical protein
MNKTYYFNNCQHNILKNRNLVTFSNFQCSTLELFPSEYSFFSRRIKILVYVSRLDLVDLTKLLRVKHHDVPCFLCLC